MICTVLAPNAPWPHPEKPKALVWAYGTGKRALTDVQVLELRKARAEKVGYGVLELRYGLGRKVLSEAVRGVKAYASEGPCGMH